MPGKVARMSAQHALQTDMFEAQPKHRTRVPGIKTVQDAQSDGFQHPLRYETVTAAARNMAEAGLEELQRVIALVPDLLRFYDATGRSIAHALAAFASEEMKLELLRHQWVLEIADKNGWTVAHQLARTGPDPVRLGLVKNAEALKLCTRTEKWSVAAELSKTGSERARLALARVPEAMGLADVSGRKVYGILRKGGPDAVRIAAYKSLQRLLESRANGSGRHMTEKELDGLAMADLRSDWEDRVRPWLPGTEPRLPAGNPH